MKKENNKKPIFLFIGRNDEPIFSKKNRKLLSDPLDDNNPITVQVLGICSALAITVQLKPAIVCLLYTSPSPRDKRQSRMPSSA